MHGTLQEKSEPLTDDEINTEDHKSYWEDVRYSEEKEKRSASAISTAEKKITREDLKSTLQKVNKIGAWHFQNSGS